MFPTNRRYRPVQRRVVPEPRQRPQTPTDEPSPRPVDDPTSEPETKPPYIVSPFEQRMSSAIYASELVFATALAGHCPYSPLVSSDHSGIAHAEPRSLRRMRHACHSRRFVIARLRDRSGAMPR
jgi:hypothetical protein